MVFVTADMHGDIERFKDKQFKKLKKTDTLIVLGDFGFIWNDDAKQKKDLKKIAAQPFKTLFIDGLNENFDKLGQFPETEYCHARASEIVKDKIYYIHRGEIAEIEGKKLLCFGGCDCYDPDIVFSQNDPCERDFARCDENLQRHENRVDYILTHMPSGRINRFVDLSSNFSSEGMEYLDTLADKVQYTRWYFGCLHMNKYVSPKVQGVYTDVIALWEEKKKVLFRREK